MSLFVKKHPNFPPRYSSRILNYEPYVLTLKKTRIYFRVEGRASVNDQRMVDRSWYALPLRDRIDLVAILNPRSSIFHPRSRTRQRNPIIGGQHRAVFEDKAMPIHRRILVGAGGGGFQRLDTDRLNWDNFPWTG